MEPARDEGAGLHVVVSSLTKTSHGGNEQRRRYRFNVAQETIDSLRATWHRVWRAAEHADFQLKYIHSLLVRSGQNRDEPGAGGVKL